MNTYFEIDYIFTNRKSSNHLLLKLECNQIWKGYMQCIGKNPTKLQQLTQIKKNRWGNIVNILWEKYVSPCPDGCDSKP